MGPFLRRTKLRVHREWRERFYPPATSMGNPGGHEVTGPREISMRCSHDVPFPAVYVHVEMLTLLYKHSLAFCTWCLHIKAFSHCDIFMSWPHVLQGFTYPIT